MSRKLKRKIDRAAQKTAPAVDEDALIERNAAFSAVFNEWGAQLLVPAAGTSDAIAASMGDFAGHAWNLASGSGPADEIAATLAGAYPRSADGQETADGARRLALVRDLVAVRRARFATEPRLVEAVLLQHLGGRRFYLALPVGWDAALM